MGLRRLISICAGFLILFFIYHFPEFFDSFLLNAIFKIGFLIVAFIVARSQGLNGLGGFGLSFSRKWLYTFLIGLATGIVFFTGSIAISVALGYEYIEKVQGVSFFMQQLPLMLVMTAFPSIAEDILTRGYLYGHFKQMQPLLWVLFSSTVYVLNHIWRLNDGAAVLVYLFMLGLCLATCVITDKSLWLAFGVHWGANIAFELSRAGLVTQETGSKDMPFWILAGTWSIFLMILFAIDYRKRIFFYNR
ncbi:MAG: CPBP family intramembrane metalloprotease [Agriterribacter sp.]